MKGTVALYLRRKKRIGGLVDHLSQLPAMRFLKRNVNQVLLLILSWTADLFGSSDNHGTAVSASHFIDE
jgi:hypothetical protein